MRKVTAKEKIQRMLTEMLKKRRLDEIKVGELAEAAGVNRNTFYYYYRSIEEAVEDLLMREIDKILYKYRRLPEIEDCLRAITEFISKNKVIIKNVYDSLGRTVSEGYLWKLAEKLVETYLRQVPGIEKMSPGEIEGMKVYYESLAFGLGMYRARNGGRMPSLWYNNYKHE